MQNSLCLSLQIVMETVDMTSFWFRSSRFEQRRLLSSQGASVFCWVTDVLALWSWAHSICILDLSLWPADWRFPVRLVKSLFGAPASWPSLSASSPLASFLTQRSWATARVLPAPPSLIVFTPLASWDYPRVSPRISSSFSPWSLGPSFCIFLPA